MKIGITTETFPGERRVAVSPDAAGLLAKAKFEVLVQSGAGTEAGFPDAQYEAKGARLSPNRADVFAQADIIVQVRGLGANPEAGKADLAILRDGQTWIAQFDPLARPELIKEIAGRGVRAFSLELIPRITRAQSMDVLSSQATVAGYKAVVLAAALSPRMFPMLMTAAGTITPAHVFVIGAGVAGLQAIAMARKLGAVVHAYDVRPAVKEQIESLGAKFVQMPLETAGAEGKGGYAKEMGEEFLRKQRELMTSVIKDCQAVITTAAIPGKKSPVLITAEMVRHMPPGAVIVDLAAERGGNCELTRADQTVVEHGVTIMGPTNLPATVPFHASQMFGRNVVAFVRELSKDGAIALDTSNEVHRDTLLVDGGKVVHPTVCKLLGMEAAGAV